MRDTLPRPLLLSAIVLLGALGWMPNVYAGSAAWKTTPLSGDWNTPANWTPATVPNAISDVATFGQSSITDVTCSAATEVDSIIFTADASAFTITPAHDDALNLEGAGIVNNSGAVQTFLVPGGEFLAFDNGATAGDLTQFDAQVSDEAGYILFLMNSSAGHGSFTVEGGVEANRPGGEIDFRDSTTPAAGNFTVNGGTVENAYGGIFSDDASVAAEVDGTYLVGGGSANGASGGSVLFSSASVLSFNGQFTVAGGSAAGAYGGMLQFNQAFGSRGHGNFVANGGSADAAAGGHITWVGSNPAHATVTANGGQAENAPGAVLTFIGEKNVVGQIAAHGGTNGGAGASIFFISGGADKAIRAPAALLKVFGNASFDQSQWFEGSHALGSIEGDGLIFLGAYPLTVGQNNRNTTFSGVIQDGGLIGGTGGSLAKVGNGILILSGSNTYTGGTMILSGQLLIGNTGDKGGSATGTGAIRVKGGTFGGAGRVAGPVIVGTDTTAASLAPGSDTAQGARRNLVIAKSLILNAMSTCQSSLNSTTGTVNQVVAHGITITQGATITFADSGTGTLPAGTVLTVIQNTAPGPIVGVFSDLTDGAMVSINGNTFQASYEGGDGNDLTLTVVQ